MEDNTTRSAASDVFSIFALLIIIVSAVLTFGFFFEYMPPLFPLKLAGEMSRIVSALFGMLIFDIGTLVWLWVYLKTCDNDQQRSIALTTSIVNFIGSLMTSFTKIIISENGLYTVEQNVKETIGVIAILSVAVVLIFNFLSIWRFKKNSNESLEDIRIAKRRQHLDAVYHKRQFEMDRIVEEQVMRLFSHASPQLAARIAAGYVEERLREENPGNVETSMYNQLVDVQNEDKFPK